MSQLSVDQGRHVLQALDEGPGRVLNETLYRRMVQQFGDVIVAKQGTPMYGGGYEHDGVRTRYKPLDAGEYYRINCPFCLRKGYVDTKHRLWINHRWGVGLDPDDKYYDPNDKFWWMCVCYNENCMANPENRKDLRTMLYTGVGRETHGEQIKVLPGTRAQSALGVVDEPGACQRVDTLPRDHVAYQYLLSRGLDPQELGPIYDISYCFESYTYPLTAGKIIIPIKMNGKMVNWQARPPYDIDWKAAKLPKYYNCPGTNKRLMLYGLDQAIGMPFCILVEGVTDVWAIGAGAVSMLGKNLSVQQARILAQAWPLVILVLDSDAAKDAAKAMFMLEQEGITPLVVNMPDGLDPASIDNDYFWDLVVGTASREGIDLCQLSTSQ